MFATWVKKTWAFYFLNIECLKQELTKNFSLKDPLVGEAIDLDVEGLMFESCRTIKNTQIFLGYNI